MEYSPTKPSSADIELPELLQSGRGFYDLILQDISDFAILVINLDGIVINCNKGVERILGYEQHEILQQSASIIFTKEDIQKNVDTSEIQTAIKHGKCVDERWLKRKDNSLFWCSCTLTTITDSTGSPNGFIKVLRDRTEGKIYNRL